MITGGKKPPTHHDNVNMDNEGTDMGKLKICPTCKYIYYKVAYYIALRHTVKILKNE